MKGELPFRLSEGFLLEKRNILLPWNAKPNELSVLGSLDIRESTRGVWLTWSDEVCLGGLRGAVTIKLHGSQRLREVEVSTLPDESDSSVRYHYGRVNEHLISALGEPGSRTERMGLPSSTWSEKQLAIRHFVSDRFGEYCSLVVRRKGKTGRRACERQRRR
jgi:hypothetical protein